MGEARLLCDDIFRGNKALKSCNSNYPLLSDGESLYALLCSIEKRERPIKAEMVDKHADLKNAKKKASAAAELELKLSLHEES